MANALLFSPDACRVCVEGRLRPAVVHGFAHETAINQGIGGPGRVLSARRAGFVLRWVHALGANGRPSELVRDRRPRRAASRGRGSRASDSGSMCNTSKTEIA